MTDTAVYMKNVANVSCLIFDFPVLKKEEIGVKCDLLRSFECKI